MAEMAYEATGTIEIAAPPEAVFPWLTDPQKLPRWTGMDSAGLLPGNSSDLHPGYRSTGAFSTPDGERDLEFEVVTHDPPHEFAFRETYRGGKSVATYRLSDSGDGTRLDVHATIDSAALAGVPDRVEQQVDELPGPTRRFARWQIHRIEEQLESGQIGSMPGVEERMSAMVNDELAKLKQCVEAA
jgi:uncharacterized protein YndB with AHSA1/START domain